VLTRSKKETPLVLPKLLAEGLTKDLCYLDMIPLQFKKTMLIPLLWAEGTNIMI
jgi:hypothetical protein